MSSEFGAVTNEPFTVVIAGRTYKVRQLTLGDLFGWWHQRVRDDYIADAKALASVMAPSERPAFMAAALAAMPAGAELLRKAGERFGTVNGLCELIARAATAAGQDVTPEAVRSTLSLADIDALAPVVAQITGMQLGKEQPLPPPQGQPTA